MSDDIVQSDAAGSLHHSMLELVQEGMTVVDSAGDRIGKVDDLEMGDPQAITTAGNEPMDTGIVGDAARALGGDREPDVPEPLYSRLRRGGYLKLGGGLFGHDRYVPASRIARVERDTVYLSTTKDRLVEEDDND
jgi:hypothetical protein